MARGSNPECCNSQKDKSMQQDSRKQLGLEVGRCLAEENGKTNRSHEGKRASVVAMEAESITRDERSRSRSMSSKRTDAEFEKLVKEDEEQK